MPKTPLNPEGPEPLLTIAEIARLDNVSTRTVRRAIAAGLLEAVRIGPGGRLVRVSRDAHAAYRRRSPA